MTAFLIGLKVEQFAMYSCSSAASSVLARKRKPLHGDIILGFRLMFYGLKIMGDSLKMLKDLGLYRICQGDVGKTAAGLTGRHGADPD